MKATVFGRRAITKARSERTAPTAPEPRLWRGLCLMFTRSTLGVDAKHPSAIEAWRATPPQQRHEEDADPPPGVPLYWAGGRYGHVALSAGKRGHCWSTDIKRAGQVDRVPIALIRERWGLDYLGWAESINGVRVYPPTAPTVSVTEVVAQARENGSYSGPVAKALKAEGCPPTVSGYARWQRRLGYRGRDADGYAGLASLQELGSKHGFKVIQ